VNLRFAQALYEDFLSDPSGVAPEWREFFESGVKGKKSDVCPAPESATPSGPAAHSMLEPIKGPALRLLNNMETNLESHTLPERSSPADGCPAAHKQERIVTETLE